MPQAQAGDPPETLGHSPSIRDQPRMTLALILLAVVVLAYSNGANDNFKGVATLFGSGTCGYRTALVWATITTLAGSLLALVLAAQLAKAFSGKGLVPDAVIQEPTFLLAV